LESFERSRRLANSGGDVNRGISILIYGTTQVWEAFHFFRPMLANEYWDRDMSVSDSHDLRLRCINPESNFRRFSFHSRR